MCHTYPLSAESLVELQPLSAFFVAFSLGMLTVLHIMACTCIITSFFWRRLVPTADEAHRVVLAMPKDLAPAQADSLRLYSDSQWTRRSGSQAISISSFLYPGSAASATLLGVGAAFGSLASGKSQTLSHAPLLH